MSMSYVAGHDGKCIGFILGRGQCGFEAIIGYEHIVGTFATELAAAKAILNWKVRMTEPRLSDYQPNLEPVAEGDDVLEPIRCFCHGDGFVSVDAELSMSAFGPNALATIAKKLLAIGHDPDRQLDVFRGGKREGRAVPASAMRQNWLAKGGNPFEAYLIAVRESS